MRGPLRPRCGTLAAMRDANLGVVLAIAAAVMWSISPMCFASAGRRVGSMPVVLLRSLLASVILLAILPIYMLSVAPRPAWPTAGQVMWLAVSGLAGMVLGDGLLYEALVRLGPRRTMQTLTLSPIASVLLGWFWLGEVLALEDIAGIALVLAGTSYAVLARKRVRAPDDREPGHISFAGLALAVAGALAVGVGAVAARKAYKTGPSLDPTLATAVRVVASTLMFWVIPLVRGQVGATLGHLRDRFVLSRLIPGTLAGPFGGMLCYVMSLKYLEAGEVSTLTAMSPLFLLPMVAVRYRARIGVGVVVAAMLAVAGVWLMVK